MTYKLENNYNCRKSLTVVKVLSHLSSLPSKPTESLGIPRESPVKGQQDLICNQDWGNRCSTIGGRTQNLMCTRTQGKGVVTPQNTEPDLPAIVGGSPAEVWGGSGSVQGQGHWQQQFLEVSIGVNLAGGHCH